MKRQSTAGFTLIELMIVVAILGILAAIAIPAFTKYVRQARTSEATMNIEKIEKGSRVYYMAESNFRNRLGDEIISARFPAKDMGYDPTPGNNACCGQPGNQCKSPPGTWDRPVWTALNFAVADPHWFWYNFNSVGEGIGSGFTAAAFGNLDCDAVYSTFERACGIANSGEMVCSPGIYSVRETE